MTLPNLTVLNNRFLLYSALVLGVIENVSFIQQQFD